MAIIKQDSVSIYSTAGGYIIRPTKETNFKPGDNPKTHHFGGSTVAGVGKIEGKGKYQEYWITTGVMTDEYKSKSQVDLKEDYEWYLLNTNPI